jgi:hypothetical protein
MAPSRTSTLALASMGTSLSAPPRQVSGLSSACIESAALVQLTSASPGIRTLTRRGLNPFPLPVGIERHSGSGRNRTLVSSVKSRVPRHSATLPILPPSTLHATSLVRLSHDPWNHREMLLAEREGPGGPSIPSIFPDPFTHHRRGYSGNLRQFVNSELQVSVRGINVDKTI